MITSSRKAGGALSYVTMYWVNVCTYLCNDVIVIMSINNVCSIVSVIRCCVTMYWCNGYFSLSLYIYIYIYIYIYAHTYINICIIVIIVRSSVCLALVVTS